MSPPRINIVMQKNNNPLGQQQTFVNHSQNFQNSRLSNNMPNNFAMKNGPVLINEDEDNTVYE